LKAGYGSATIVQPLDLDVESGQVLAILGPNGAGKTTLMMTLAGLISSLGGTVMVDGRPLPAGRASLASRAGIVLVPDDRALFTTLNVVENLEAARRRGSPGVAEILQLFPALEARLKVAVGALSGGEQQMLAVARALVQRPRVLLVDEMSMGLAPVVVEELFPRVRVVAETTGAAVVLVEQHVQLALEVADEALVLLHGDVVLRGSAKSLAANPAQLEAAYLGATSAAQGSRPPDESAPGDGPGARAGSGEQVGSGGRQAGSGPHDWPVES
jgi:branched-chain amino acid transport system ATP-binding protein